MVTSFVLASGSIKALAEEYGVSYPTMRNRLDSLIDRLKRYVDDESTDPLSDYLADQIRRGHLQPEVAREIRRLHRELALQGGAETDGKPGGNERKQGDDDVQHTA